MENLVNFMLKVKPAQVDKLVNLISTKFNVIAEMPTTGKFVFRIDDVVCNIFSTGTVSFQGKPNQEIQTRVLELMKNLGE